MVEEENGGSSCPGWITLESPRGSQRATRNRIVIIRPTNKERIHSASRAVKRGGFFVFTGVIKEVMNPPLFGSARNAAFFTAK